MDGQLRPVVRVRGFGLLGGAPRDSLVSSASINGKILGTVTDQNGAVVPNATVNAINEGTGAKRTVNADENGFYVFPELPVGFYMVEISGGDFASFTQKH